jgi:hypothetical protein
MYLYIEKYIDELWFLLLEMAPWLLLGLIFAGLLKVYFPQKHIDRYLGKSDFKLSLNASLLGIPMPLCSCGVIPTAISFYKLCEFFATWSLCGKRNFSPLRHNSNSYRNTNLQ